MLEFNGKRPILKNLIIEPIALSDEQNQELDKIIASKKGTLQKHYAIRKVMMNNTGGGSAGGCCPVPDSYRLTF